MSFSPPGLRMGAGLSVIGLLLLFGLYKRDQRGRPRGAPRGARLRALLPGANGANGVAVADDGTVRVAGVPLPRVVLPDEDPVEAVGVVEVITGEAKEVQA
jgi:hypothetical protein